MNKRIPSLGVLVVLSLCALPWARAQDHSPTSAAETVFTEHALKILSNATRFVETAPAFMARGELGGELMLANEQLVEHGTRFTVLIKRPFQMKWVQNSRDGSVSEINFDGETITMSTVVEGQHVYDTVPQPGDVNESLEFLASQFNIRRDLEFLLSVELTQSLSRMQSGVNLGKSLIGEVQCDHLAFRTENKDGQAWVARGSEPAPWRILVTHRLEPLKPRLWVQFAEWNFNPEFAESTFGYSPPDGAKKFDYFEK
jgi:hypothetical protein